MKNRKKQILCLLMGLVTLSMLNGCAKNSASAEVDSLEPMEVEEVYKYSYDLIGGDDVMPIGAYYGPTMSSYSINGLTAPTTLTDEFYQDLVDAGINYLPSSEINYASKPELNQKILDLSYKYNIATTIKDLNVMDGLALTKEQLLDVMIDYIKNPGFTGVFLYDECGTEEYVSFRTHISQLESASKILNNEFEIDVYNNAVGMQAFGDQARADYRKYVIEYLEKLDQKYFIYTDYPGFDPKSDKDLAFEDKKE